MTVWVKAALAGPLLCMLMWLTISPAVAQTTTPSRTFITYETPRKPAIRSQHSHGSIWPPPSATSRTLTSRAATVSPPSPPRATLTFDPTCTPGRRAVIAAVGDLLFHDALQLQALRPGHSFRAFWAPVASVLANVDLTYGNLESPIAAGVGPGGRAVADPGRVLDRVVYGRRSTELVFNTHPSVAADLAASGFDVISTANNHSADRGVLGIDRTLDALDTARLAATGTRRSTDTTSRWSTRATTANGLTIAWLACTFDLNGMPDSRSQVLQCYRDLDTVQGEIKSLAADPGVDAVIFTPHWGVEGAPRPQAADRGLARLAVDAGATAVIGTHPHVIQPWEKHVAPDGREGLIIYSTGNFISNQKSDDQRTGIIALLEVTKPDNEPARLSAAGYVPTFVQMDGDSGHRVTELSTSSDALRRLPAGNRVMATAFRSLPRVCAPDGPPPVAARAVPQLATPMPVSPDAMPPLPNTVATATAALHPSLLAPAFTQTTQQSAHDEEIVNRAATAQTIAPAQQSARPSESDRSAAVSSEAAPAPRRSAPLVLTGVNVIDVAAVPHLPPPPRAPPAQRQDPLRPGRLRLDVLLADAQMPAIAVDTRLSHFQ